AVRFQPADVLAEILPAFVGEFGLLRLLLVDAAVAVVVDGEAIAMLGRPRPNHGGTLGGLTRIAGEGAGALPLRSRLCEWQAATAGGNDLLCVDLQDAVVGTGAVADVAGFTLLRIGLRRGMRQGGLALVAGGAGSGGRGRRVERPAGDSHRVEADREYC